MKKIKLYIYLLLFCIFLQNGTACINLLISIYHSQNTISFLYKKSKDSTSEEDKEENEKESKEESKEENKEENQEKEKEFKNIKYLNPFVYLSSEINISNLYSSEDSEIFSQHFEIETPPPKNTSKG